MKGDASVINLSLMDRILKRSNLIAALHQVKRNGGSPGIDGMTVEQLPEYLSREWPAIKSRILEGSYRPKAVKRVEIPKPDGRKRLLGIPTVSDRFIQQAVMQVLQSEWDITFSDHTYGFRPNRSAHQAVAKAQEYLRKGYSWVVDMDIEKFFDTVNHDRLMHLIKQRVDDRRILVLINSFLKSGVEIEGKQYHTPEGMPQGGPLSPLLSNLMLDQLDKELEKRGHRFVRYADDCNIYVRSIKSGRRVLDSVSVYLLKRLKLKVNQDKSAVDRPWRRKFLGFTFTVRRPNRRKVSYTAMREFKREVKRITKRTRGYSIHKIARELRRYILGWKAYFDFAEAKSIFKELDSWVRRRLRCYLLKQWGRRRYRELRRHGVSRDLAWNTAKSAHGPWRLSRSPALAYALPFKYFAKLGIPTLREWKVK
jgi:RNA-directed DNA polymerase